MTNANKRVTLLIHIIILLVIIVNLLRTIIPLNGKYFQGDYFIRYPHLEKTYKNSIYVNKKGDHIADEELYAYAAGQLLKGGSPVLVNPETPPLGKYLTSLSILLFDNENIIILISFFSVCALLYILGRQVFLFSVTALAPPLLISFEPLFINQLRFTPLFDIIQLVFLLLVFIFFNIFISSKKNMLLYVLIIQIFIGCFIATKFFATGAPLIITLGAILILHKEMKHLIYFILTLPLSVLILLATYIKLLFTGYSLRNFLGVQKWIYEYNKGHLELPFTVWPLLLLNKWYVWFGDKRILSDKQWLLTWPVSSLLSFLTIIKYILRRLRIKREVEVVMAWTICYLLLLSVSNTSVRYFILLIPGLYVVTIFGIEQFISAHLNHKSKNYERRN